MKISSIIPPPPICFESDFGAEKKKQRLFTPSVGYDKVVFLTGVRSPLLGTNISRCEGPEILVYPKTEYALS